LLQLKKIFCTEPLKIPQAGKVKVLAFDKTGTLTEDKLEWKSVNYNEEEISDKHFISHNAQLVLAGCH
jgi:cation-transporting ATPase 13A1